MWHYIQNRKFFLLNHFYTQWIISRVLARHLPKGTLPFGGSNVPLGSVQTPTMMHQIIQTGVCFTNCVKVVESIVTATVFIIARGSTAAMQVCWLLQLSSHQNFSKVSGSASNGRVLATFCLPRGFLRSYQLVTVYRYGCKLLV